MSARVAWLLFCAGWLVACSGSHADSRVPVAGDAKHGAELIQSTGCGSCHAVPGIRGAVGVVGPPLDFFSRRTYIAGRLPNTPANLARWILDPQTVSPGTAMPRLGLDEQQARDVAAYLYTLK
jgi:cytochrome c1